MHKIALLLFSLFTSFVFGQESVVFDTSGTGTFTVPAGVTEITVEVWGAGGKGGNTSKTGGNATVAAGGGGGGAYSSETITVTSGQVISYTVGAGSTGTNPGETSEASLNSTVFVRALGGASVNLNVGAGAAGGQASSGIGTISFNGGNGANGSGENSGGGGSSAGISQNGNDSTTNTGAIAPLGGGDGGNGVIASSNGTYDGGTGGVPGAGGGGSAVRGGGTLNATGGSGADGQVVITYESNCSTLTSAFSSVTDVSTNYIKSPEQSNLYTEGGNTYSFALGTDNDLLLEAFQVNSAANYAIDRLADKISLKRAGTTGQGADGEQRHILFFEQDATYGSASKNFNGVFFPTMDEALVGTGINRGSDNVFVNSGGTNINNVQRLDYIFEDGIVVPSDPSTGGFPVFERGGNDAFNLAIISNLDANANPSEYNTVISYAASDWENTGQSTKASVLSGFPNDGGNLTETVNLSSQSISVIFVSFEDMGLSAGDIIYGYSLAGADSTTDCSEFLDFENSTFFPQNTTEADGGIDLLSGGSFSKVSFIHTETGWYQNDDPNAVTPTCDDALVVSGGEANITKDMTFNSMSTIEGTLNLNNNTLDICNNINTEAPFEVVSGTLRMNGTEKQFISGTGSLAIDQLELDNANGLDIDTEVELSSSGVLRVTNGILTANEKTTFRCGFGTDAGGNVTSLKTAQIDVVTGNIVSNNNFVTEQCYPGRRAFRLVSPSATTSATIRANWQEGATAWDDNPNPGYGTHITGVSPDPNIDSNPDSSVQDGTNGFDWQPSGNASMFEWNNNNGFSWSQIGNTDVNTLTVGKPYLIMIRGSRAVNLEVNTSPVSNTILRETGDPAVGDVNFDTTRLGITTTLVEDDAILVGNPYQAIVDLADVFANSTGIKNTAVIWDPRLGGANNVNQNSNDLGGRGAYITLDPTDWSSSNPDSEMNQFLQPMQSVFFFKDASANPVNIAFKEAYKQVTEGQTQIFREEGSNFKMNVMLYDEYSYKSDNTSRDAFKVNFVTGANNALDENDFLKSGNLDENLARFHSSSKVVLAMEERDEPIDGEELPMFINQYRTQDYVFRILNDNVPNDKQVYLKDAYTEESHLLEEGENIIHFSVDHNTSESEASDRFSLVFELETLNTAEFDTPDLKVYPNPIIDELNLNFKNSISGENVEVQLIDILGRQAYNKSHQIDSSGKLKITDTKLSQGVYILKVSCENGAVYTHKILKQ